MDEPIDNPVNANINSPTPTLSNTSNLGDTFVFKSKPPKKFSPPQIPPNFKKALSIGVLALLIVAAGVGAIVIRERQTVKKEAEGEACQEVGAEGVGTGGCPTQTPTPTPSPGECYCLHVRLFDLNNRQIQPNQITPGQQIIIGVFGAGGTKRWRGRIKVYKEEDKSIVPISNFSNCRFNTLINGWCETWKHISGVGYYVNFTVPTQPGTYIVEGGICCEDEDGKNCTFR